MAALTDEIDLHGDSLSEALALRPFGGIIQKNNIMQIYESFCTRRLAFDMGRLPSSQTA